MATKGSVLALCLLSGTSEAGAQAQPAGEKPLEGLNRLMDIEIDVSSARASNLFSTPSTVSVVDRSTLDRYGIQTMAQALDLVAGISIQRSVFNTDLPTSRGVLQEGYANRVLLLINGVPCWNVMTGDLFRLFADHSGSFEAFRPNGGRNAATILSLRYSSSR
jgi:outer membrane receptor for Fe3+-dicitrate